MDGWMDTTMTTTITEMCSNQSLIEHASLCFPIPTNFLSLQDHMDTFLYFSYFDFILVKLERHFFFI